MFFKYRPVLALDLPECSHCLRDRFSYDSNALERLLALWQELLRKGNASPMVIEDISRPPGSRIVWFCMKVFVKDDFADYLKTDAPPGLGRLILDLWSADRSPLMCLDEVRRANSPGGSGLNLVVLNSGSPPTVIADGQWPQVASKVIEFTPLCAGGYRLTELLIEVYDDFTASWVEGTGMHLRTDYPRFYEALGWEESAQPRARLYGITPSESAVAAGKALTPIFQHQEPCFGFKSAEQELLLWALFGETDEELGEALNISPAGIRKRWNTIYDRVIQVSPFLLSDTHAPERRGIEKKRRLMGYLRHHLEELRPVCKAK